MKTVLATLFVLSLGGCGTTGSVAIVIPSLTVEQLFTFRDERPTEQRASRNTVSSAGSTLFYADDNLSPPPAEMLRRIFMNRVPQVLKGRTVTLTEFDVHVTSPTISLDQKGLNAASQSVSPGAGALATPVIFGIESMRSYKSVTVEIRGSIDGTEIFVYHSDEFQGRVTEDDIRSVILVALDRAVTQVQRTIHERKPVNMQPTISLQANKNLRGRTAVTGQQPVSRHHHSERPFMALNSNWHLTPTVSSSRNCYT